MLPLQSEFSTDSLSWQVIHDEDWLTNIFVPTVQKRGAAVLNARKARSDFFYKKWANPGLFFLYLLVFFKQTLLFLQQINVKKCPSSKWHRDLNPRPLEHESSPMTTRPELPPNQVILFVLSLFKNGTSPASFCLFSVFTNNHYPFHNNIM